MKTSDFNYVLPQEMIAQTPAEPRDSSRLLALHRENGGIEHLNFRDIGRFLNPGDLLVINQTRVIPARIYARKESGGKVELLLLRQEEQLTWRALVGGKGLVTGKKVVINIESGDSSHRKGANPKSGDIGVQVEIIEVLDGAQRLIRFEEPIEPFFSQIGNVPLPPYIHAKLEDPERYQTVYAQEPGSAAAPTAGLHFTNRLLDELKAQGVGIAEVTLHVGLDTFAPVTEENADEHHIHTEWCEITPEAAKKINEAKEAGGRIIAVGTTSVRTLESAAQTGAILPMSGPTSLFILPGYKFQAVGRLITNFHLPKSTLLMLVSAFAEREQILNAYEVAKEEGYRFCSFGDAMIIL
ncbi:MAG: tRNA preQ1(34) S-adenosylmethionine ribosyltransferase-isomerase QueA [Anaerolineales bacterium]|uniref:S-adenosylmethionine:tRNA ribosyltransferase-isomerase n=1 Tax=Candidatus Desulfolinea nitratireducens TaxID=2841698 RepID=A0A8J6NLH6_9CHLR|nr:tRNA preQ1(34) S-adenosylmethionine ribosyltransferase-isomerase QueA [Candidatus Desulfolinea nitratireducens]MBL6961821.1 tRNA preQ1(34) S-adenosylmethionine ribosyltransferase-isomerase QueA [Anaerolineales bacterium]